MAFGIQNTEIPPAPSVQSTDYNTIAIVGIAPKGPTQSLVLCGSDTDDSQFGKCLTGFSIPRALSDIRSTGAGKVIVVNVFDKDSHTTQVTNENATVTGQQAACAYDPIEIDAVAATSSQSVTTGAANLDTIASISVGSVDLISQPILFTSSLSAADTARQIVSAINEYTSTSGYSATAGTLGAYTITGPVSVGGDINGIAVTFGATTGTIVLGAAGSFSGGVNAVLHVKNTPVSAVSATAASAALAVTTAATSGDTLASLKVNGTDLLSGTLTFTSTTLANNRSDLVAAINAYTSTSGYSASSGSGGAFTITGPSSLGATLNGVISTIGTITGTFAIATNGPFNGGVTAVTAEAAVTYIEGTDYTKDEYGNISFITAIPDGKVVRLTYKKLNAGAVTTSDIIGDVVDTTRTGCKLIDNCETALSLVPKIFIIPNYNQQTVVQTEMERLNTKLRMRSYYTSSSLTIAQAIASRTAGGALGTFNTSTKRGILFFNKLKTYDPKTGTGTLTDPSAVLAGHLSYSAAVNGPQESTSNTTISAVVGVETELNHAWEDASSAADTNRLRSAGIQCIFSDSGYKCWGAENASYPNNTAVNQNITVRYVADILTDSLTKFVRQYVDRNITQGSIDNALTAMNDYYSGRMTAGWIGKQSKVSFKKERNPDVDLQQGKVKFTRNTFYFVGMKLIELEENMEVQLPTV